jgi:hypothetical protein
MDCGDVIGVYEPLVHVIGATARRTSLAADPETCSEDGDCYHAGCYEHRQATRPDRGLTSRVMRPARSGGV